MELAQVSANNRYENRQGPRARCAGNVARPDLNGFAAGRSAEWLGSCPSRFRQGALPGVRFGEGLEQSRLRERNEIRDL